MISAFSALLAQQALELCNRLGGVARAAQKDGEVGARLPESRVQLDRPLQAAPAFVELAAFQQQMAEVAPGERQCDIQLGGAPRQIERGPAIDRLAEEFGIGEQIQGRCAA